MKLGGDDRICFAENGLLKNDLFEEALRDAGLDKGKAPALVAILGRGGIDCTEESKQASEFISVCTNDFVLNLTNSNCRTLYSAALKMYNDKDAEPAEKAPPKLNFALFIPNAKIDWSMFTNPIHDVYLKYKDAFEKGVKGLLADLELSKRKGEREEIEGTVEMLSPSELAALAIKVPTSYQVGFFIVLWKLYFGSKESSGRTTQAHDAVSSRIWEIAATMSDISFTRSTAEDGKDYCYSKDLNGYAAAYQGLMYVLDTYPDADVPVDVILQFLNKAFKMEDEVIYMQKETIDIASLSEARKTLHTEVCDGVVKTWGCMHNPYKVKIKVDGVEVEVSVTDPRVAASDEFFIGVCERFSDLESVKKICITKIHLEEDK